MAVANCIRALGVFKALAVVILVFPNPALISANMAAGVGGAFVGLVLSMLLWPRQYNAYKTLPSVKSPPLPTTVALL